MNITNYIASGVLADYCMGVLLPEERLEVEQLASIHPEIKQELDANLVAIERYAAGFARQPKAGTKQIILALLNNLQQEEDASPDNLPLINKFSSHQNWLKTIKTLLPAATDEEVYLKVIKNEAGVFQAILWLKSFYPDEVHTAAKESALVLQGECTCFIGNQAVNLSPGSYLEIPLNTAHNIKVTNGPVLAIIQRLKVA